LREAEGASAEDPFPFVGEVGMGLERMALPLLVSGWEPMSDDPEVGGEGVVWKLLPLRLSSSNSSDPSGEIGLCPPKVLNLSG
jgi:hypothetical protein